MQVVQLHNRHLLLPERYPRFTLLGQALGSVRLGYEALTAAVPEVNLMLCRSCCKCVLLHDLSKAACTHSDTPFLTLTYLATCVAMTSCPPHMSGAPPYVS